METSWQKSFWQNFAESLNKELWKCVELGIKDIFRDCYVYAKRKKGQSPRKTKGWSLIISETILNFANLEMYATYEIKSERKSNDPDYQHPDCSFKKENGADEYVIKYETKIKKKEYETKLKQLMEMDANVKKVLITYYEWENNTPFPLKDILKSAKENISNIMSNGSLGNKGKEKFLFILGAGGFGYEDQNDMQIRKCVLNQDFHAFMFNSNGEFIDLDNIPILRNFI